MYTKTQRHREKSDYDIFVARVVLFGIAATSSIWPFTFVKIKQILRHTSYLSSAQQPGVASSADGLKNFHH